MVPFLFSKMELKVKSTVTDFGGREGKVWKHVSQLCRLACLVQALVSEDQMVWIHSGQRLSLGLMTKGPEDSVSLG